MTKSQPDLVLLVEDDDVDAMTINNALHKFGGGNLNILRAENGVDALEKLKTNRPDLIIMDIRMPMMDGKEALAKIKSDKNLNSIPIIMMSTSESEDDINYCYEQNANA